MFNKLRPRRARKTLSPNGELALEALSHGWGIVPIHNPVEDAEWGAACSCEEGSDCLSEGQHPFVGDLDSNILRTTDEVKRLWEMHPKLYVGIQTGAGHGVAVQLNYLCEFFVDVVVELEEPLGPMPFTPKANSTSGSEFHLFKYPDWLPLEERPTFLLGSNAVVMQDDGYIVLPSADEADRTLHVPEHWEWEEGLDVPLAELPPQLVELIKSAGAVGAMNSGAPR